MRPLNIGHQAHDCFGVHLFLPRTHRHHDPRPFDGQEALARECEQEGAGAGYPGDRRLLGETRPGLVRYAGDTALRFDSGVAESPVEIRDGHLTWGGVRRHRERAQRAVRAAEVAGAVRCPSAAGDEAETVGAVPSPTAAGPVAVEVVVDDAELVPAAASPRCCLVSAALEVCSAF